MSNALNIDIKIDDSKWKAKQSNIIREIPITIQKIIERLADIAERKMKSEAPVARENGGTLKKSITTTLKKDSAIIEPKASYTKFVVNKTRASPGRYVPAIGKRLVNPPHGTHPGTKADPFVDRTTEEVMRVSDVIAEAELTLLSKKFRG